MIRRVQACVLRGAAALLLPLSTAVAQTFLGGYTGTTTAGNSVSVHAGSSSVRFTFIAADIVRVDFLPAAGSLPDSSFAVLRDTSGAVSASISETDSTLTLDAGAIRVLCRKNPLRFSYCDGARTQLLEEPASGGLGTDGTGRVELFALGLPGHFYGTGERGVGPDLRGRAFDSYNTQAGGYGGPVSTMNINIPFLASTLGCALFVDNTYPGRFDIGFTRPDRLSYRAAGGELTLYVIAAATVQDQLERYTWLTGRQPLPPRWAFGYLQSKFGYRNETEARTMVQTMRQKGIPCDAIILDVYWFDRMGDLSWYAPNFPAPDQMMADFLVQGFKTVTITEPDLIINSSNWSEASAGKYLTTDTAGHSYLMPNWWSCSCPASLVDMTKPSARSWWWGKHPAFFGVNLAGIWTDLGEPERHPLDMQHALGSTAKVHNVFNLLWAQSIAEGFSQLRPGRRLFNLTRSGFAGIQRYGVIPWSGDVAKSFGGLAVQIPMLLNMGMSGLAYHNSDIGGFCCGTTTPELYVRWMEYGTFCPVTRAHGAGPAVGGQDTEPWSFGGAAEEIARRYIRLRYQLLPYIYTLAYQNQATGMPLARPLFFAYPGENVYQESSSYLWGDAFLVSPVVQGGQTSKTLYLPQGKWIDFWTDRQLEGGNSITVAAPLETLPLFVKAGSIIPMQPVMNFTDERPLDTLSLAIYPSAERAASFTLYEDDGATLDYLSGSFALTSLAASLDLSPPDTALQIVIGPSAGDFNGKPPRRVYLSDVHGVAVRPDGVVRDGAPLRERTSYEDLRMSADSYFYDSTGRRLFVNTPAVPESSCHITVERFRLVAAQEHSPVPPAFMLEQNYPNPFNPVTVIRYAVPRRSRVVVKIYDLLGRKLATLVDGMKDPGTYEVRCDAGAIGVSAGGVYFYRLEAGEYTRTKKLMFLR